MALIEAGGLTVLRDAKPVVRDVSLTLDAGEVLGLVGPNGSGKSTLVKALLGLLPHAQGSVKLVDRELGRHAPEERARLVGYLPQHPIIHWPLRVAELVALGRYPRHRAGERDAAADREAVERAMAAVHVGALATRPATELSGGERMRVHIARLLAGGHAALCADEPTASLDPYYQLDIMETLRQVAAGGIGVLVVLHELELAARYCDRLIVLADGAVAAEGPPDLALSDEVLARVFRVSAVRGRHGDQTFLLPLRAT
ncbi:MAG: ABC transporter ATP-binding protein [Gammaproteobacteria bacterium]|nr:ABC transporter ATP-binding protein [Gammaproteobacteria bacterium]